MAPNLPWCFSEFIRSLSTYTQREQRKTLAQVKIRHIGRFLAARATVLKRVVLNPPSSKRKPQRAKYNHRSLTQMRGDATVIITSRFYLSTKIYYSETVQEKKIIQKIYFSKLHCSSKSSSLSLEHQEIRYPERHHLSEKAAETQDYTEILTV